MPHPSLDLMEFIESQILPQYAAFDPAHDTRHAVSVIRRSLHIARQVGADINMAYAAAAYHDLGLSGPRAKHHITGGQIVAADQRLRRWFSPEQIRIIKEAVEDHRASASHAPRSIYGKIVAEADRDLTPDVVFRRTIEYGLTNFPELDREGQWQRFAAHMKAKYATGGYIRLWIHPSDNEKALTLLRQIIDNAQALHAEFDRHYETLRKPNN